MAMIRLDLEVNNRGDAALKQAAAGLDGVGRSASGADKELKEFTKSQQSAAMRMQRLHDEALKMNQGFKDSEGKAQLMAGALGQVSSTAAQTADALGLPIGKLSELTGVFNATEGALGRTTKGLIGFSGVLVGAVGAGLMFGAMLGTWARELPIVRKYADDLAESLRDIARVHMENLGMGGVADWLLGAGSSSSGGPIDAAKGAEAVVDAMLRQGKTLAEIRQHYKEMPPEVERYIQTLERFNAEQERLGKIAKDDKKLLDEQNKAAKEAAEVRARALDMVYDAHLRVINVQRAAGSDVYQKNVIIINALLEAQAKAVEKIKKEEERLREIREANAEEEQKRDAAILAGKRELADALLDLGDEFGGVFGGIATLAGGALHALANLNDAAVQGASIWAKLGGVIQGALGAFNSGSVFGGAASGAMAGAQFGPLGAAIGAGAGGLLGLLGGAFGKQKEHMKVNDLRDQFVEAAGGIAELDKKAREAGVSLDRLLRAKTVKDYEDAVKDLEKAWDAAAKAAQDALDLQREATEKLDDAMQRYGITIDEMGPKFAQQKLDEQAAQLLQDYQLLAAAGADMNAVLSKMAPSMSEYVQQAIKAGSTIPENLRPIIEDMIRLGLLTDESGNAFTSAEEAGIEFGKTLEESMASVVESIDRLIREISRLYGLPPITIPLNVPGLPSDPGPSPNPPEVPAAVGFEGMVHGPTRFLAGEAGPEYVSIKPAGKGKSGGVTVAPSIIIQVDPTSIRDRKDALLAEISQAAADGIRLGTSPVLRELQRRGVKLGG